jgi:hypothetical protein
MIGKRALARRRSLAALPGAMGAIIAGVERLGYETGRETFGV